MVLTAASRLCPETPSPQNSLEKDGGACSINYKETWSQKASDQDLACARMFDKTRVPQEKQNSNGMRLFNKTRPLASQGIPMQPIPPVDLRCVVPAKGQEMFGKRGGNNLLQSSSSEFKEQRHPRPPRFPRSHSSKDSQQTPSKSNGPLKAGRRILYRSYSSPNISSTNSIKLPKPTQNLFFKGNKTKDSKIAKKNEEKQRNMVKELPSVGAGKTITQPWKIPFLPSKMVKQIHPSLSASSKSSEPSRNHEDEKMMKEMRSQSNGSERDEENEWDWKELSPTSKHVVFVMNHDDGRLETFGTLQPVPEEPEHEQYTCNSKSLWHYHDTEPRHHVVEDLFESEDEGMVMKSDNSLDPIKKAMINNWIIDVTLKTSQTEDEQSNL